MYVRMQQRVCFVQWGIQYLYRPTHLNLFCEDVFESVNVDQGELSSVGQGGRVGGRRRDKRRKVTSTHYTINVASFKCSLHTTHTHTAATFLC